MSYTVLSRSFRRQQVHIIANFRTISTTTTPAASMSKIIVGPSEIKGERIKGAHWKNDNGTAFKNPWSSFNMPTAWSIAKFGYQLATFKDDTVKNAKALIPHVKPNWGADLPRKDLKATWLGHACTLIEMPAVASQVKGNNEGQRGVRVLFDPVLGPRMAFWGLGPARESTPPCEIEDIPEIDVIAISHNHYDHLDLPTLTTLLKTQRAKYSSSPVLLLPLNNRHIVSGLPIDKEKVIELDWWEGREIKVDGVGKVRLVCTPCQHSTARYLWDRDNSLWSSWVIQDQSSTESTNSASVWFGGDTGYCTIHMDIHTGTHPTVTNPKALPQDVCPAFKEIGERLGPFTLGLIPIGAYSPRLVMSPLHAAPVDSVRMFEDTKCKQAIAIHWGTFRMTNERFTEPPEKLEEAMEEAGLETSLFNVCKLGESRSYEVD
ncbi:hypothetical protein J007_02985 [Cryptococcus neoformans]|nr:hypothetical protein J007_02985 [Cryptococcus neoformans var. grubii]OXC61472.1 hypothetical protein C358_03067 [Cryptococcus neoformans var. grubii MW-RSA852]